jgi:hypothetical protein
MKVIVSRKVFWKGCIVVLIIGALIYALDAFDVLRPEHLFKPEVLVPTINTRGHLRNGTINPGHNKYDYTIVGAIPGLTPGTLRPDDLFIVIHGFNNTPKKAANILALASESLREDGFDGAIIGFSWDANTQFDAWNTTGFHECRRNACENGPKLARFVLEYKARCPNTRVHILGYSIGCRLALETALALYTDPAFADTSTRIDSIFLAGAAVDNEEVQTDEKYGAAIENRVGVLYNFYSLEDKVLGTLYPIKETDLALGETDIENPEMAPSNYVSVNVENELRTVTKAGIISDKALGDNHLGCLGIWDDKGNLVDDGVMNVVADLIRQTAPDETTT